jgi:hypothetical protein
MVIGGILIPYALMQHNEATMIPISPKLSLYSYFLPTCQNIWHKYSVIEILETSGLSFAYKPVITFTMS